MSKEEIKEIEKIICSDKADLVGTGEVVKDSWYQVYKYEGKYYAAIFYDSHANWLLDGMTKEISEEEIEKYI